MVINQSKEMKDVITFDNFFKATEVEWKNTGMISYQFFLEFTETKGFKLHASPYYGTGFKSFYAINEETGDIYRMADHWGNVGTCKWDIDKESEVSNGRRCTIAKANIKDFKPTGIYSSSERGIPVPQNHDDATVTNDDV